MTSKDHIIPAIPNAYPEGTIISGQTGMPVSFESLLSDLSDTRIVYIGESHTRADHHEIQFKLIQSLAKKDPEWAVGMEMFDYTYQNILNQWSDGNLDEKSFLEKSHWYANWRYDFELYRNILLYIRESRLRLLGLNIPFHLPPKIAIGGIESLSPDEKKHLPSKIDTTNPDHRTYVSDIFKGHQIKGRNDFEYFYLAQCVWEDAMAERIASGLEGKKMIVLAGNGHILRKFGIPDRTFSRTRSPFRTIYLASKEGETDLSYGDYIWITP
ncbi:MAG: ChaN family lipoprotein [Pseudomonadota bacterium]